MEMKSWDFKENSKNVSFARRRRCRVKNEPVWIVWSAESLADASKKNSHPPKSFDRMEYSLQDSHCR